MKKTATVVFLYSILWIQVFAQWSLQTNPYGYGRQAMLGKIQFVSQTEGWIAASNNGSVLHTTNAGNSWNIVTPFPNDSAINMSDPGKSMSWTDSQHGWVLKSLGAKEDNDEDMWNLLNGAVIYATTDGGNSWNRTALPKAINTTTYSISDMEGGWKLHAICAKDPDSPLSENFWIHADGTVNKQGMMSISGIQSNNTPFLRVMPTAVNERGKISINGQEIGFLNSKKNLAVFTGLEMNNAHALYLAQKIDSSVVYYMNDLQGTWNLCGISTGNNTGSHPSSFHSVVTANSEGSLSGILTFQNNEQIPIATSISIDKGKETFSCVFVSLPLSLLNMSFIFLNSPMRIFF